MHVKICKNHGELIQENIIVEPNKSAKRGYTLRCSICKMEKDKKYREANREKLCAYSIKWKKENRKHYNEWERQDRKNNPEKYRRYEENYTKKHGKIKIRKMEVARIHGLTIEEYDFLFESQNHLCKICGKEEIQKGKGGDIKPLCVDHCHICRDNGHLGLLNIRGLLCGTCNAGLGQFLDNPTLLQSAIQYLQSHEHKEF